MTVEEFDQWIVQQEDNYEYIGGEISSILASFHASCIAATTLLFIGQFVMKYRLGRITGANGGYKIANERYMPDVTFISYAKQPNTSTEPFLSNTPNLAVEVISNLDISQEQKRLRIKLTNYLLEGVTVWVINPETQQVEIYRNDHPVEIISKTGIIRGYDVLPNFELAVKDIFEEE